MTFDIRRGHEPMRDGVILKQNYIVLVKLAKKLITLKTYMDVILKLILNLLLTKHGLNCTFIMPKSFNSLNDPILLGNRAI